MKVATRSNQQRKHRQHWAITVGTALVFVTTLAAAGTAAESPATPTAGTHGTGDPRAGDLHSPYAGQASAGITGLLPNEVEALSNGSGMALALPAELNGYPGPRHVLDAVDAGQLSLRPDQREAIQRLYDRMLGDAKAKGQEILQEEASLATRFCRVQIDEVTLRDLLERIGRLRVELRFIHLRTHLATKALLTPEQIARYNAVRGYDRSDPGHEGH